MLLNWILISVCFAIWIPVQLGLWISAKRKTRLARPLLQVYVIIAAAAGIWIGLRYLSPRFDLWGGVNGWIIAAVAFAGMLLLTIIILPGRIKANMTWGSALGKLLYFLIAVGVFEEVWFRGIWFACFDHSFFTSVILGSVVFGLWHYNPFVRGRGFDVVLENAILGLVFAAARYNGAGIVPLALAHGVADFISLYVLTEHKLRYGQVASMLIFIVGCLAIAAITFLPLPG